MERQSPISLKIEYGNSLRRATVNGSESLAQLKATVSNLVGVNACEIKYRDEEDDLILVGSDRELRELLATAPQGKPLRIIVTESAQDDVHVAEGEPVVEDDAEEEEKKSFPFEAAARALSDKANVAKILAHFQSDALINAVTSAASTYVESGGDFGVTAAAVGPQLASLQSLVLTVVSEIPELKELLLGIMTSSFTEMFSSHQHHHHHHRRGPCGQHHRPHPHGHHRRHCPGAHGGAHGGGPCHPHRRPCHPHHSQEPHHPQHNSGEEQHNPSDPNCRRWQKHPFVVCDGCDSDNALKQASIVNGHQTRRGFIAGQRFKSQTVHDFDLCESCKASGRFPEAAYGPFVIVPPPVHRLAGFEGRRRGCNKWRPRGEGGCANWRDTEQNASGSAQKETDFFGMLRQALSEGVNAASGAAEEVGPKVTEFTRAFADSFNFNLDSDAAERNSNPDGWVPVASQDASDDDDPFIKWSSQLKQLQDLGFEHAETYINLLEEEKGNLDNVVDRIVNRMVNKDA